MDMDDDPMNGCEKKVNEKKCKFGKCRDWGKLQVGDQCGNWENLYCAESDCCECKKGKTNELGYCMPSKTNAEVSPTPGQKVR